MVDDRKWLFKFRSLLRERKMLFIKCFSDGCDSAVLAQELILISRLIV